MACQLENMTWVDIQEKVNETSSILIPIGSVEVEGPHLPLGVDSIVSQYVANKVGERTNLTVAPLISISYSEWHKKFSGTISIKMETLTEVLRQYCNCLIDCGFKRFFFINSHAGNDAPIFLLGNELRGRDDILVGMVNLWQMANEMAKNMELDEKAFLHAGEIMTSVMLAIRPDLVNMEKAKAEYVKTDNAAFKQKGSSTVLFNGHSYSIYRFSNESTRSGVMGDPTTASEAKGQMIINNWVSNITAFLQEFKDAV